MKNMNNSIPINIFPKPKSCHMKTGIIELGEIGTCKCYIMVESNADALIIEGVELLRSKISEKIGVKPFTLNDTTCSDKGRIPIIIRNKKYEEDDIKKHSTFQQEEEYTLSVDIDGINIWGSSPKGTFYAIQTLLQTIVMYEDKIKVPMLEVKDWPDMKYRGLFIEDRYGSDRMELKDWKEAIDYMASLKLNFLRIGLYGCWCIQYDNRISEYLYVPLKNYPELKTSSLDIYYSPKGGKWEVTERQPEMYKEDFLSEIIEYGKKRNVIVSPLFNSLGHNTLIPRTYPETSAIGSDGKPTGYGFCTSNEKTYEVLFGIYDEIIERYLEPNDIDWFHIGIDEVRKILGVYPEDYFKEADPWCKCDICAKSTNEDLIVKHIIKISKYLKLKGIKNIMIYNDQLLLMEALDSKFAEKIKQEGLEENLVLDWWRYRENDVFQTIKPELGLRTFVKPMTGYYNWALSATYLENINKMLRLGYKDKAEGAEAYAVFDYSNDRNYCCLSEYSWNRVDSDDIGEFDELYINSRFPYKVDKAKEAIGLFEKLTTTDERKAMLFVNFSYYWYSYVRKGNDYPRNFPGEVFEKVYADKDKHVDFLKETYNYSSNALKIFEDLNAPSDEDRNLIEHYKVECLNFKVMANEYLTLIDINDILSSNTMVDMNESEIKEIIEETVAKIQTLISDRENLMLAFENTKATYILPFLMRNMSIHREYLKDMERHLRNIQEDLENGINPKIPIINFMDTREIQGNMFKELR